ncbi:hypothetical protein D2V17_14240 [Aurantiacibacter xanthus]|uniref:Mu-like prophage I protein n=1 Tax=Aurantiacibacter xanthus TaxID=1784712 RepID=A0A3A1P376_9SPHN|nr:phage protease [Aurantiacibacter xanthus]RIV82958.1 hypothetical protein D2V17_14240 [Aurantiacibacter xanthus]
MGTSNQIALCSAFALGEPSDETGKEWVHLLPAGGVVNTADRRGPYVVEDYHALMSKSLAPGGRLVLDENHSTDLAAPKGLPAPARGWIVALQLREDGIWGEVEWNDAGRQLRREKAYSGISPVIAHTKDKRIVAIRRASLVNQPNLEGLTALNQEETSMDWKMMLIAALGLDENASDDDVAAAMKKALSATTEEAVQSALLPIGKALGLADGASAETIIAGIGKLSADDGNDGTITALQSRLDAAHTKLDEMEAAQARTAATAFVDSAIAEGRPGVKAMRDDYIAMHMENPARTEKLIGAKPALGGRINLGGSKPARSAELDDADAQAIALMGIDPEGFKKARAAELGENEEAL